MTGNMRLVAPGEETDQAVVEARLDYERRFTAAFGFPPPREALDAWWPLGGDPGDGPSA